MEENTVEQNPGALPTEPRELSDGEQAYLNGLTKLMHNKKTAPQIEKMLQAGPPEKVVPETALKLNDMFEQQVRDKKPPSLELLLNAAIHLVGDLVDIGNAAGYFEITDEQELGALLQTTMQSYIERGLKNGTIDPIELQQKVEPLMEEADRAAGVSLAEREGIPVEPNEHTAMEVYASRKMKKQGMLQGGGA